MRGASRGLGGHCRSPHTVFLLSCGRLSGLVRSHTPLGKTPLGAGLGRGGRGPVPGRLPARGRLCWMKAAGGAVGPPTDPFPCWGTRSRLLSWAPWAGTSGVVLQPPPLASPQWCVDSRRAPPQPPEFFPKRRRAPGDGACSPPPPREQRLLLLPPGSRPVPSSDVCLSYDTGAFSAPDSSTEAQWGTLPVAPGRSRQLRHSSVSHALPAWRSGTRFRAHQDFKCSFLIWLFLFLFFAKKPFSFLWSQVRPSDSFVPKAFPKPQAPVSLSSVTLLGDFGVGERSLGSGVPQ